MNLFNNQESDNFRSGFAVHAQPALWPAGLTRSWMSGPASDTPASRLLVEIFALVLALHVWLLLYLHAPKPALVEPKPLAMQVTLIAEQKPQAKPTAPPQPQKPPPQPPKKTKPKATLKPKPQKTVPKETALPTPKAKTEALPTAPEPQAVPASEPLAATPSRSSNPASAAPVKPEPFIEANYKANYGFNPKPSYPRIARSRGWQGKVLLKVQVSAAGTSQGISVHKSSGHDILDEAAVDAVQNWRFIPARRGNTPVASSVIVPILFSLQNN